MSNIIDELKGVGGLSYVFICTKQMQYEREKCHKIGLTVFCWDSECYSVISQIWFSELPILFESNTCNSLHETCLQARICNLVILLK